MCVCVCVCVLVWWEASYAYVVLAGQHVTWYIRLFLRMLYITETSQTSPKGVTGVSCRSSCYLEQTSLPNTLPKEKPVLYRKCSENGIFITWRHVSHNIIVPYTRVSVCLSVCVKLLGQPNVHRHLSNPKIHHRFHNSALLVPVICQMNPMNIKPLKTKSKLFYLKTESVPRCKHFSFRL